MMPMLEKPKLAVDSAIDVQKDIKLPDNPNLPMIGVKNSANVTLASNGQGTRRRHGQRVGRRSWLGQWQRLRPGLGRQYGGGVYRVGGGVSAPVPIITPEAEFSDEARRAKYQGE